MGQHDKFKDLTVLSYGWCLECQWQENQTRKLEKYAKDIPKGFRNKGLHSWNNEKQLKVLRKK